MKSKTSLFSRGIILNDFKLYGFLGGFYTIILFFMGPFWLYDEIRNVIEILKYNEFYINDYYWEYYSVLHYSKYYYFLFICIITSCVLSVLIFRYIQSSKASSKIHSMPITRKQLYNSHIISGLTILTIPVIINTLLMIIIVASQGMFEYFPLKRILLWGLVFILVQMLIYVMTSAVGMLVGTSILNVGFAGLVCIAPILLLVVTSGMLDAILYGYSGEDIFTSSLLFLSPITKIDLFYKQGYFLLINIVFWLYIIICYISGLVIYNKRDLELCNEFVCFKKVRYVAIYLVTYIASSVAFILASIYYGKYSITSSIIFMLLGGLLAYIISTMVCNKTLHIYKYYKGFIVYFSLVMVVFFIVKYDVIGYGSYIPNEDKIESIYINNNYLNNYNYYYAEERINKSISEKENKDKVLEVVNEIIDNGNKDYFWNNDYNAFTCVEVQYNLKNGKNVSRSYYVDYNLVHEYNEEIFSIEEYKVNNLEVFNNEEKNFDIIVRNILDDSIVSLSGESKRDFVEVVKQDILDLSYDEYIISNVNYIGVLQIMEKINNGNEYISSKYIYISSAYKRTIEWLKENEDFDLAFDVDLVEHVNLEYKDSTGVRINNKIEDNDVIEEIWNIICEGDVFAKNRENFWQVFEAEEIVEVTFQLKGVENIIWRMDLKENIPDKYFK